MFISYDIQVCSSLINNRIIFHPKLAKVGSVSGIKIGKHPDGNSPFEASSVQQPCTSLSGVRVMSWSRNWPNCITIRVACQQIDEQADKNFPICIHFMPEVAIFTYMVILNRDVRVEVNANLPGIWQRRSSISITRVGGGSLKKCKLEHQ